LELWVRIGPKIAQMEPQLIPIDSCQRASPPDAEKLSIEVFTGFPPVGCVKSAPTHHPPRNCPPFVGSPQCTSDRRGCPGVFVVWPVITLDVEARNPLTLAPNSRSTIAAPDQPSRSADGE
jgi:hypothetical protein